MYIDPVRHSGRPTDDRIPQEMAIYDELLKLVGAPFAGR